MRAKNVAGETGISIRTLPGGVRVVMEPIPYVQSVALGIWVRAGAVDEDPRYAGVSHYIEHMLFKGTKTRSARDIAAEIDRIGGQINAFTGKEATCFYVKTLGESFETGADVLLDMLTNSVFDGKEMARERQVICEEIKMIEDQPDDLAHDTLDSLLFRDDPLGHSITGTPTTLSRISRRVIMDYMAAQYSQDAVVISVAGRFEPERVIEYLSGRFETLRATKPREDSPVAPYQRARRVVVRDIQQSHLCLGTRGISLTDPLYYAMSVLNNILGGSMSSRLFQTIREEEGLAYSVYSTIGNYSRTGYFSIYAGVSHDKIREAIQGIRRELLRLKREGVTEEELSASKEQLKSSYIFGQENVSNRMFGTGKNLLLLDHIYTAEEILAGLSGVTMEDIERAKALICDLDAYSAVAVTNRRIRLADMMEA